MGKGRKRKRRGGEESRVRLSKEGREDVKEEWSGKGRHEKEKITGERRAEGMRRGEGSGGGEERSKKEERKHERRHQKRRRGSKFEKLLLSVCRLSTTNTLGLNSCRRPWHVFTCSQQLQRRISRGLFTVQNEPLVPHCRCTFKRLINPYIHSVGFYMGWVMKRVFLMRHLFKTLKLVWIVSDRPQWSSTETILLLSWSDLATGRVEFKDFRLEYFQLHKTNKIWKIQKNIMSHHSSWLSRGWSAKIILISGKKQTL